MQRRLHHGARQIIFWLILPLRNYCLATRFVDCPSLFKINSHFDYFYHTIPRDTKKFELSLMVFK